MVQLEFKRMKEVLEMPDTLARLKPFTKWTGGKRQLLPELLRLMPTEYNRYYEPFIGGGALFFELMPEHATINDFNSDLIHAYKQIRDDVTELIKLLEIHTVNNEKLGKDYYLEVRGLDRNGMLEQMTPTERAARLLYMLRVNFNGLYRVNSKNQFNVPYGRYKNPKIVDKELLYGVSKYLNACDVQIRNEDFENAVADSQAGDFVYCDPPYAPVSATSAFTAYTHEGFGAEEQTRLRDTFVDLTNRRVKVMLSNSDVGAIHELYEDLEGVNITIVGANRMINSISSGRGKVNEVIIRNYE